MMCVQTAPETLIRLTSCRGYAAKYTPLPSRLVIPEQHIQKTGGVIPEHFWRQGTHPTANSCTRGDLVNVFSSARAFRVEKRCVSKGLCGCSSVSKMNNLIITDKVLTHPCWISLLCTWFALKLHTPTTRSKTQTFTRWNTAITLCIGQTLHTH